MQSSAAFLHMCSGFLFLFFDTGSLAQSGLKQAAIFLLPPVAGTTRHAPSHLALWSPRESYIPRNTFFPGSRVQILAWENLPHKVQR